MASKARATPGKGHGDGSMAVNCHLQPPGAIHAGRVPPWDDLFYWPDRFDILSFCHASDHGFDPRTPGRRAGEAIRAPRRVDREEGSIHDPLLWPKSLRRADWTA